MVAVAAEMQLGGYQEEFATPDHVAVRGDDINECYFSLDVEGLRAALPDDYSALNILNEIRRVSRELVEAGIRNVQFGESARKGDTLVLGIRDLERGCLVAFLESVGIAVSEEDFVQPVQRGSWDIDMGDELRASNARREARRKACENECGRLAKQREHVARYIVREKLGDSYDIEFVDDEGTQFVVLDEKAKRTFYVGKISEKPTLMGIAVGFSVLIREAKYGIESNGQFVYMGRAEKEDIFNGRVREINTRSKV